MTERCDDGGHTTTPWSDQEISSIEQMIRACFEGTTILSDHLARAVDLRWPGLLALVRLGAHPLRLRLIHGQRADPSPVGPDVLGVDIEKDPDQLDCWHAVLALEPATGPGGCAVLLSGCLERQFGGACAWPRISVWFDGLYCPFAGDVCWGPIREVVARLSSPDIPEQPGFCSIMRLISLEPEI